MRESQDIATAGVPNAMYTAIMAKLVQIANNTAASASAETLLPVSDQYEMSSNWTASDSGTTAWNLLDSGVDTAVMTDYISTTSQDAVEMDLGLSDTGKTAVTQITIRVLLETAYSAGRFFTVKLYKADDTEVFSQADIALAADSTPETIELTTNGAWTQAEVNGMYLGIIAQADTYGMAATIYEAEVQVT
jgi:hypothetical protein